MGGEWGLKVLTEHNVHYSGNGYIKNPDLIDWTGKMWHIYTMEYYAAIKTNEFVFFVGT